MYYFQCDATKAQSNLQKHGVSFSEAATVFFDGQALLAPDPSRSRVEARLLAIGKSEFKRI